MKEKCPLSNTKLSTKGAEGGGKAFFRKQKQVESVKQTGLPKSTNIFGTADTHTKKSYLLMV